jgi:Zn finger protein HypA/HybF involved in hydrogenase expression
MIKYESSYIIEQIEKNNLKVLSNIKSLKDTNIKCKCLKHNNIFIYNSVPLLMRGYGCPICKKENILKGRKNKRDKTFARILKRFKDVHGDKYDYSKAKYISPSIKLKIYCKKCKKYFYQSAANHYSGHGCPYCYSRGLSNEERLNRIKHSTLKFINFNYTNSTDRNIKAECLLCGNTFIRNYNYFINGYKCPFCCKGRMYSIKAINCIDELSKRTRLKFNTYINGGEKYIKEIKGHVDGYNDRYKIVVEFQGDTWHGNPKLYKPNEKCHPFEDVTAKYLYDKTKERINKLKKLGYLVIEIWESSSDKDIIKGVNKINERRNKIKTFL